jgi:hypothetical protein
VLHRLELRIAPEDAEVILDLIRSITDTAEMIPLPVRLPVPYDAAFLEVAAASGSILTTGNARHFPKNSRAGRWSGRNAKCFVYLNCTTLPELIEKTK